MLDTLKHLGKAMDLCFALGTGDQQEIDKAKKAMGLPADDIDSGHDAAHDTAKADHEDALATMVDTDPARER